MPTRLCLIGHSGAGKSTTAELIRHTAETTGRRCSIVKVATPLYELQQVFYARLGTPLPPSQQDQQLLESVADWMRQREPEFLIRDFLGRVETIDADVIVNDDVRSYDFDYPRLRAAGWTAIRVVAPTEHRHKRLSDLGYLTRSDKSTVGVDTVDVDHELHNDASIAELRRKVITLLDAVAPC